MSDRTTLLTLKHFAYIKSAGRAAKKLVAAGAVSLFLGLTSGASQAQVYGSYNMGCIDNAQPLALQGEHYVMQIWGKGRNYAHPDMLDYLDKFITRTKEAGLPDVIIGDLSQKYGGPYAGSNHASHMVGLDVDIPFGFAKDLKDKSKTPDSFYLVRNGKLTDSFDDERIKLIYLAAQDERVERIFVSPRIKEGMCKLFEGKGDDSFLAKLRPWFGHRAHMHVRLACPSDSPYCKAQAAAPEGTGCGYEVQSWFMPPDPNAKPAPAKAKQKPVMPQQCKVLLSKNG